MTVARRCFATVRAECTIQNQRRIHECPRMRVLWILPAERRKELSGFELKICRQRGGLQIGFFKFDRSFVVLVEL